MTFTYSGELVYDKSDLESAVKCMDNEFKKHSLEGLIKKFGLMTEPQNNTGNGRPGDNATSAFNPSPCPRRAQLDKMTPAERAIYNATFEVELIGADERLTNAVIKLQEARELVADYVDSKANDYTLTYQVEWNMTPEFIDGLKTPNT